MGRWDSEIFLKFNEQGVIQRETLNFNETEINIGGFK